MSAVVSAADEVGEAREEEEVEEADVLLLADWFAEDGGVLDWLDSKESRWPLTMATRSDSVLRWCWVAETLVSKADTSVNRMSSSLPVVNRTIAFRHEYSAEST